ncbi:hypothetical protein R1sor_012491 [Riccia sorocarpa]|uniref:Fungal lipase-like domain-containing protein n=1 Tax=Riccia sorocarpa TaxID=122646 RepID=A0ABD3I3X8_9MARC
MRCSQLDVRRLILDVFLVVRDLSLLIPLPRIDFEGGCGVRVTAIRSIGDYYTRQKTNPRELNGSEWAHEDMASLVKGVYARDKGDTNASRYWEQIGYSKMDIEESVGESSPTESGPQVPIRVMVFKRRDSDDRKYLLKRDDVKDPVQVPAPKYVVAIRGTMSWKDVITDKEILREIICELRPLYEPVMKFIKIVHDMYSADGGVWVAGHSLGAMLALVATRRLAIDEQIVLEAHLFNPPFISFGTLAKKAALQVAIGAEDVLGMIPGLGSAAAAIRRGAERFAEEHERILAAGCEVLLNQDWASAVNSNDQLINRGYCPHLYVNQKDFICNEYIRYFGTGELRPISFTSIVRNKFGYSENRSACHRLPQAYLHTNHWGKGKHEPHKLHQWFSYDPVGFKSAFKGSS